MPAGNNPVSTWDKNWCRLRLIALNMEITLSGTCYFTGSYGNRWHNFTGESLQRADLIDHLYSGWRIIVEDLFVPCEILCQQQLPLLVEVLGKNGCVEYFLLKAGLNYKAMFYC